MKSFFLIGCLALIISPIHAEPAYVDEAPLPKDWPTPGPYGEVVAKAYPAYRAAFTKKSGETRAFWTLFMHIKKHDIPMTAPVEMPLKLDDDNIDEQGMAFLYQNRKVGQLGQDGEHVEVRDIPKTKTLSYAWQGRDSAKNRTAARQAIIQTLESSGLKASGFRLLGYNGPRTPTLKKTWELQAVLE